MEASVPVFGNCCLDLPVDSDGVSEDTVSIDADALVDSESEAGVLRLADCEALSLKLKSGLSVLSGTDILVEVD